MSCSILVTVLGRHRGKSSSLKYRVADGGEMRKPEPCCEPNEKIVRWEAGTLPGSQEEESGHMASRCCCPAQFKYTRALILFAPSSV